MTPTTPTDRPTPPLTDDIGKRISVQASRYKFGEINRTEFECAMWDALYPLREAERNRDELREDAIRLLKRIEDRFITAESSYHVSSAEEWLLKEVSEFIHRHPTSQKDKESKV
jgi:hypothetical protein